MAQKTGVWVIALVAVATGCRFSPGARPGGAGGDGAGVAGAGGGVAGAAGSPPALDGLTSIEVQPRTATVILTGGQPAAQPYKAVGTFEDGHTAELTGSVAWTTDDPSRGTASAQGVVTTGTRAGGLLHVTARAGDVRGAALLNIRLQLTALNPQGTPAIPAAPAALFDGPADAARAPELVYPNNGVLLPPNLGAVEIHFRPGSAANALFEVGFANDVTDVRVYTRCVPLGDGCLYETAPEVWSALAETNRGGAAVTLTVRGTADAGGGVGASAPFKVRWSRDPLRGALYYWTTTTPVGIARWNFGDVRQTAAEKVVGPESGDGQCIGCHALSRDGGKMVMTSGAANVGKLLLFDAAKKVPLSPFPLAGQSWFESWNPSGSQFVGVNGAAGFKDLLLFDGTDGAVAGTISVGGAQADHPDWSPQGDRIVFTEVGEVHDDQTPGRGGISYVEQPAGGGAWSAPRRLVPSQAGVNRYYPTVAADDATIVFNESTCPAGKTYNRLCDGDVDPSARLFSAVIPASGPPAPPIELAAANAGGVADKGAAELTTSYARWSPFAFQLAEGQALYWVSFSSSRQYGLRSPTVEGEHHGNPSGLLIWMAGVDPNVVAGGTDGSFPAFCLPFQSLATSNHIAQWTSGVPMVQ